MDYRNVQEEPHLKDYADIVLRRRNIVIAFFSATVIAVTVGCLLMDHVYRATATLLIDVESPDVLTASGIVELESQQYFTYKEYYNSQKEIIKSRSIAKKVFNEFDLGELKEYKKAKDPLRAFMKKIIVEPIPDTRLIMLHVENEDPALAADLANSIAKLYVRRNLYYITQDELMNLLKNEYLKLENRLSEYSKIYKEKHPKMIRLKEEMAETAKKIEKTKNLAIDRDIDVDDFGNDYRYTLESVKANNISILDPAVTPKIPIKPKKRLSVLMAMIVGLFGGVGLAFFCEYLDDTIKGTADLKKATQWPFLGSVPDINNEAKLTEFEKDLFVHKRPKDPVSEAYRAIRTSIIFSATEEHPLRSVIVTSPGPVEGKTTTVCNIGITIAQSRKKVLIVDADMRKPRLHDVFNKANDKGLSSYLCDQAGFDEIIQNTGIDNLYLVNGGPHPPDPSELLASHKMEDFINTAKKKFDFILFDTPPIAVVTDSVVFSKKVDGIIMVIESGKTSKKVVKRVYNILDDAKSRVIGAIINKIRLTSGMDYYYHSHYYGR
jgi:capsular exopolysaccharide synthesis family protein